MKQSKTIKLLLTLLTFLLVAYIAAVIVSMVNQDEFVFTSLLFPLFFTAVLAVVLITFAKSNYEIKGENLVISVSIARTTIPLDTVTTIKFLKTTNELILCHFVDGDPRLNLVQIHDVDYDAFVKAMRNARPQIIYQEILDDAI
ncbi:MAG: hypothetical protein RR107_02875 [Clostridia bacterium]